jgi:hypothetical protein
MTKENANFMRSIATDFSGREFWNQELSDLLFSTFSVVFSDEDLLSRLHRLSESNLPQADEMGFVASHFHELQIFDVGNLDFAGLQSILSSPIRLLGDESSFYEMIHTLCSF